jgi:hypothetical protein
MGSSAKLPFILSLLWVLFPISSNSEQPAEHLSVNCGTCHDWHPEGELPVDEACMSCHQQWLPQHDAAAGVFHQVDDRSCSRCHGYHSTEMIKATGNTFLRPFGDPQVLRHCSTCHRSSNGLEFISEGHLEAAAQQYHIDAPVVAVSGLSEVCLNCHDQESGNPFVPPSTPAFPAHASHPVGTGIPQASPWELSGFREEISPDLELFEENMECITCHRIPEPTVFLLVPFPTVTDLCNGCHDMAPGLPAPLAAKGPAITRKTNPSQVVGSFQRFNN